MWKLDCQQVQSVHQLVLTDVSLICSCIQIFSFINSFKIKYNHAKYVPVRSAYSSTAKNRFSLL